jgi:hypothetical protein
MTFIRSIYLEKFHSDTCFRNLSIFIHQGLVFGGSLVEWKQVEIEDYNMNVNGKKKDTENLDDSWFLTVGVSKFYLPYWDWKWRYM